VQPHQEIVDWFDASEHIWTVAKALYGDDTSETNGWAKTPLIDDDATGYQLFGRIDLASRTRLCWCWVGC
jgi:hypothetical protein